MQSALLKVKGVKTIEFTGDRKQSTVKFDSSKAKVKDLIAAVESVGYGAKEAKKKSGKS